MLRSLWLIFAQACMVALGALFVLHTLKPQWLERSASESPAATAPAATSAAGASGPAAAALASLQASPHSLAEAAALAAPAVVSIGTSGGTRTQRLWPFGGEGNGPERRGMGSGVIVEGDGDAGYVLTNHHVVDAAQRIDVQLSDGREASAELVGADPETDLALLRIPLPRLPVIAVGASKALRVGDPVLAIGNPFGVGQTVTAGIVSALQRQQLGINVFESFIQTDAAINPGNSGGALVDGQGRLVGINSAIYSRSGGSVGLGFAIPIELAQEVMQALRSEGRVARGWMGVTSRELSGELMEALRLPPDLQGVLVAGVQQGSPAEKAGVRPGDVITQVGQTAVSSPESLLNAVARLKPGAETDLRVQRGRDAVTLKARVGQRPIPK
jgi:serine protease DegQ